MPQKNTLETERTLSKYSEEIAGSQKQLADYQKALWTGAERLIGEAWHSPEHRK